MKDAILVGLDIESYDPLLKELGTSWRYDEGHILCISLCTGKNKRTIAGIKNTNTPVSDAEKEAGYKKIKELLQNENVCFVGANITYDLGFILYELKMEYDEVKASLIDVLVAESLLDEYSRHSLDTLAYKYLKENKQKTELEYYFSDKPGDFRQHLKEAPWEMLVTYCEGDADLPLRIWEKQKELLQNEDLISRFQLEMNCILPCLHVTKNGIPVDIDLKTKNQKELEEVIEDAKKYIGTLCEGARFRITASRDVAALCKCRGIPFSYKITIRGKDNKRYTMNEIYTVCRQLKMCLPQVKIEKKIITLYIQEREAPSIIEFLRQHNYIYNCEANINDKFYTQNKDKYPEVQALYTWKKGASILSKVFGEKFDSHIYNGKVYPVFKLSDTISKRMSCVHPNMQQIPSKGSITVNNNEYIFAQKTRSLFGNSEGKIFWKIDYGQIEYRLICNIACGQEGEKVRSKFRENPSLDFHQYVVDLTGLSRKEAKNMSFGVSFGLGKKGMMETYGWSEAEADKIIEQYHENMSFLRPTIQAIEEVVKKRKYIRTACKGRARLINENLLYTFLNRYTQGSAAEIFKSAIVAAEKAGIWKKLNVVNMVHDEFNGILEPTNENMSVLIQFRDIMITCVPLRVPLMAEIEIGTNWSNTKTVETWLQENTIPENVQKAINFLQKNEKNEKNT